jgi:ADP-dependent NAD(P)H-hydrate dehydratase / NAD(P)H-hydrate epimerase
LAGRITGFIGQGVEPYDAAVLGGYIHGLAGNLAAQAQGNTRSVIAEDVLNAVAPALTKLSR